jgi:hypothetical protein
MKNVPQRKALLALDSKQTNGQLRENLPFEMSLYYMPLSMVGSARLGSTYMASRLFSLPLCSHLHGCPHNDNLHN